MVYLLRFKQRKDGAGRKLPKTELGFRCATLIAGSLTGSSWSARFCAAEAVRTFLLSFVANSRAITAPGTRSYE
jgi:hypothetical protein